MAEPAVQVRAGAAVTFVAVAPGALRVEDAAAGRRVARGGDGRPRLCERRERQARDYAGGVHEDAKPSSHAADYMAASRRRRYFNRSGSVRLASTGSVVVVNTPTEAPAIASGEQTPAWVASSAALKCSTARIGTCTVPFGSIVLV